MRYYLIAGEPSGDLHGANLMRGLAKADPEAEFRFWGGDMMAEAGGAANLVKHYRETSFFGIADVLANLGTIARQMRECREDVLRFAPDVLILIDYPGFNVKMAEFAHRHGLKVFYYIAPKVWAWKEWRVKALRRFVDRLYIIFPFEKEYFRRKGIDAAFEGNPLMDAIARRRESFPSAEEFRRANGLDDRPVVALLAGSRRSEIRTNLCFMAELAERIPNRQFVVAGVSWIDRAEYDRCTAGTAVRYVFDKTYELLAVAEAAVVTSGTATLETALLDVPEVVVYGVPWIYEKLKPYVLKIPYVSLVNLNLGREAVREIVQCRPSVEYAEAELRAVLEGGAERERMKADFAELRRIIVGDGASERFAARMVEDLKMLKR
ncbi:lipid-A-disaccharide synthase [Alistipes sp. Z76]|nr:lipid-A-disaccharide synthase [Alistipes sp. Z76]NCE68498.1 lipid-A-disaccharide synthase [Muribaculaceae bacterium M3]